MNKGIKIIDLLNMIAEGKELPENIKYDTKEMKYDYNKQDYLGYYSNGNGEWLFQYLFDRCRNTKHFINDTVEIIEDKKGTYYNKDFMPVEEDNKITPQDVENLGYACNKIRKSFEKGWNKCEEDNNKIEKLKRITKLISTDEEGTYYTNEYTIPELAVKIDELIDKVNSMEE